MKAHPTSAAAIRKIIPSFYDFWKHVRLQRKSFFVIVGTFLDLILKQMADFLFSHRVRGRKVILKKTKQRKKGNPMNKLFSFSGRAGRAEYWKFGIVFGVLLMIASFIDGSMAPADDPFAFSTPWAQILVFLVILIPSLAVAVRRLHDRNKSGWWLLIVLVPIIGPFWLFVDCGLLPAKEEGNSY